MPVWSMQRLLTKTIETIPVGSDSWPAGKGKKGNRDQPELAHPAVAVHWRETAARAGPRAPTTAGYSALEFQPLHPRQSSGPMARLAVPESRVVCQAGALMRRIWSSKRLADARVTAAVADRANWVCFLWHARWMDLEGHSLGRQSSLTWLDWLRFRRLFAINGWQPAATATGMRRIFPSTGEA